jgi:hypothetical protein
MTWFPVLTFILSPIHTSGSDYPASVFGLSGLLIDDLEEAVDLRYEMRPVRADRTEKQEIRRPK